MTLNKDDLHSLALGWLKELLRIDTSNPPGNERPAIEFIARELGARGIRCTIVGKDSARPNLVAEVLGSDPLRAPLLLSSHVDVVPAIQPETWSHPPFAAVEAEGAVWGRGAIDMKYKTAFDMAALVNQASNVGTAGEATRTLKMVALADEEQGGEYGVSFMVGKHRELINAECVFNEVGGFTIEVAGATFLPLQAGEKSSVAARVTLRGSGGHASIPAPGNCIVASAAVIQAFASELDGYAITPLTEAFITRLAHGVDATIGAQILQLLRKESFHAVLHAFPDRTLAAQLAAMVQHTACPVQIASGTRRNVVPEVASIDFDMRLVPGVVMSSVLDGMRALLRRTIEPLGVQGEVDFVTISSGYELTPEHPLLTQVANYLIAGYGSSLKSPRWLPLLMPASSDNSVFYSCGITPIGCAPLLFPSGFSGLALAHGVNERLPLRAFEAGLAAYIATVGAFLTNR